MATKSEKTVEKKQAETEMVRIRLFKDNGKYNDDKFVAVNGKTWQIKRGEDVMIPKYVADVLELSERQDTATANLIEQETRAFANEAKVWGI